MLVNYTKKQLDQLAKIYEVKGAYKLKKAELIETLMELIPVNMDKALVNLGIEDLEAFEEIIKEDKIVPSIDETVEYVNLIALGLIEISEESDQVKVRVDERIKEAYKKLDLTAIKEQTSLNSNLRTHMAGLLNLYGVVGIDWAVQLYNRDYTDKIDREALVKFVETDDEVASRASLLNEYIADETVYAVDEHNLTAFIKATENKPYYVPSKEYIELVSYDDYYDNTLHAQALKSYLKKNITTDEILIDEAICAVTMIARVDCSEAGSTTNLMLEEWAAMGLEITNPNQIKEVTEHIKMVANNTRKWINRGFTADELRPQIVKRQPVVKKLDIGRNAACPCGSGKKYKKCCGRNK